MRISIIGTGYVGLSAAVGFAKKGHDVTCFDVDGSKLDLIDKGKSPIYEPLIDEYLKDVAGDKLRTSRNLGETITQTDVSFICVGTPSRDDGSMELGYIERVSQEIGTVLKGKNSYHVIVVKSTVLPETTENVVRPAIEKASGKRAGEDFGLCMNPEFLREGCALEDFMKPDRIVIGELDRKSGDVISNLYSGFDASILRTNIKVAEMIKYASNAFLATKISYTNEIGNICKKLGIDVYDVMKGVGMDHRISPHFLQAGCGFGGSCFPKDVSALVYKARKLGYEPELLKEVLDTNERQKVRVVDRLEKNLGSLKGKKIAVLGLAFKANTDDIREAPAIRVISELKRKGAVVSAHDPQASGNMKKVHPDVSYHDSPHEALRGSDAALILTDWDEYKKLTDEHFKTMNGGIVIEGRKALGPGIEKDGICW